MRMIFASRVLRIFTFGMVSIVPAQSNADFLDVLLSDESWLESCDKAQQFMKAVAPSLPSMTEYDVTGGIQASDGPIAVFDLELPGLPVPHSLRQFFGGRTELSMFLESEEGYSLSIIARQPEPIIDLWAKRSDYSDADRSRSKRTKEILGSDSTVPAIIRFAFHHGSDSLSCSKESIYEDMKLFLALVFADSRPGVVAVHKIEASRVEGYVQIFEANDSEVDDARRPIEALLIGDEREITVRYQFPASDSDFERTILNALTRMNLEHHHED